MSKVAEKDIKKLIENSFLSKDEKSELLKQLESKGSGVAFFGAFNDLLKKAIDRADGDLKKTIGEIDRLEERLDDRITGEKERIEENMEKELSAVDPADKNTKNRIWDEYYDNLDRLGTSYERGVKEILSKITAKL